MIYFNNDYSEGCHEKVLERLIATNMEQTLGYGEDEYCSAAAAKIRAKCGREDIDVHFLVGGTQANLTVIDAALRPHQGALGADTAHINVHETGAVEATGHKVLWVPNHDGKLTAAQVRRTVREHYASSSFEHTVQPKLVYISHPTELGHHLGDEDVQVQFPEALHVVQEVVQQTAEHQYIPAGVEDQEILVEGNEVVQEAVHHVAAFRRDQIFRQKIQREIHDPCAPEPHVPELRFIDPGQAEAAIINHLPFHCDTPRREDFWDNSFWRHSDRESRCAGAGRRPAL